MAEYKETWPALGTLTYHLGEQAEEERLERARRAEFGAGGPEPSYKELGPCHRLECGDCGLRPWGNLPAQGSGVVAQSRHWESNSHRAEQATLAPGVQQQSKVAAGQLVSISVGVQRHLSKSVRSSSLSQTHGLQDSIIHLPTHSRNIF